MTHERRLRLRSGWALGLLAGGLAALGAAAAHEIAMARQRPVVVLRFLAGYFDRHARFVPTAGRGATNVDRNALLMFVFSGAIDMGPNIEATLPLTISEQSELAALTVKLRDNRDVTAADVRRFTELGGDPDSVFEPGVLARRRSFERAATIVATGSVSAESVQIASVSSGGQSAAQGAFFKVRKHNRRRTSRNRFIFNPRFVVATFNRPGEIDYNPEGFEANTTYQVTIHGGDSLDNILRSVTNLDGVPLPAPFSTTFSTSNRYVQDFSRPEIVSTIPIDGSPNIPSDQDVEVTFSEPMDITSFVPPRFQDDDAATVRVRYSASPINGGLAGRNVLSLVRIKPQTAGNVVQLRPLQTFGRGPYEIEVTITSNVTDLSGNDIIRQQQFTFTTAFDPSADFIADVVETYDTNAQQDTNFGSADVTGDNLLADWNTSTRPGELSTSVRNLVFSAVGPTPTSLVNVWFTGALRWQALFPANDMGGRPRTITGFNWIQQGTRIDNPMGPPTILNTQSNLTYANTQVKMGHATDSIAGGGFPGGTAPPGPVATNYKDVPVTVVRPVIYTIPVVTGSGAGGTAPFNVPGPTFEKNFNFNGLDSVILEVEHNGNGTTATSELWGMDGGYSINGMTFSLFRNVPVINQSNPWYMTTNFSFLSPGAEAQSLWYNTQQPAVRYVPQQIVPFQQPQGTVVAIQWQGAKADVNDPSILDGTTITPWTTDIRTLATFPFVRWHIELVNNLSTGESSSVDTLTIPFTYR